MKKLRTHAFAIVGACAALGVMVAAAPPLHASEHAHTSDSLVDIVRSATRTLRTNPDAAKALGYEPFLGCVSGPQEGAMGVHFVNAQLVGDGELDAMLPEALIYEPDAGRHRLVGVEYIVLADAWHANHELPPALGGQVLQYNAAPNRYGLPAFYEIHVWAWRDNPNGTFVDWHPRVSCNGQPAGE
jgi:hypothetical protein